MKSRSRGVRVAVLILVPMFLLVTFGILFRKPVAIRIIRTRTEREFRGTPDKDGNTFVIVVATEDWAFGFGGKSGLDALDRLRNDPDLLPYRRAQASHLHEMISAGEHLP